MRKNEQAPAEANVILKVPYYAKHFFFLTIIRVSVLPVKATEIKVNFEKFFLLESRRK